MTQTLTRTSIQLGLEQEGCREFAGPLYLQLSQGSYDVCSVLDIPHTLDEWRSDHRTARKRADRCARLGYRFAEIKRENHSDDLYAINTSLDVRQGRPMSAGYRTAITQTPLPDYPCPDHAIRTLGVLQDETLVAYLWLYVCGELALVSQILGHGQHLENDVMYLLFQGAVETVAGRDGYLVYNRADSGTEGLRFFKARLGFRPQGVRWLP